MDQSGHKLVSDVDVVLGVDVDVDVDVVYVDVVLGVWKRFRGD